MPKRAIYPTWQGESADGYETIIAPAGGGEYAVWKRMAIYPSLEDARRATGTARGPHARRTPRTREGWTYEGYWNAVLGANRSSSDVIDDFDLNPLDRRGLDEWLGQAEADAWAEGGNFPPLPPEWDGFHQRALRELTWVRPTHGRRTRG